VYKKIRYKMSRSTSIYMYLPGKGKNFRKLRFSWKLWTVENKNNDIKKEYVEFTYLNPQTKSEKETISRFFRTFKRNTDEYDLFEFDNESISEKDSLVMLLGLMVVQQKFVNSDMGINILDYVSSDKISALYKFIKSTQNTEQVFEMKHLEEVLSGIIPAL